MHISDGALAAPVLVGGAVLTLAGVCLGLRRIDLDNIMTTAVLASVFFVGSLIHVPLGPSSVHLLLNGLAGMVLGWAAFPCILVALLLQAVLFQFGGLTVLGVNTFIVALPAILCRLLLQGLLAKGGKAAAISGFVGGSGAVLGTALLAAVSLGLSDEGFLPTARIVVLAHVPVMLIEGVITMFAVAFLVRARPELLGNRSGVQPGLHVEHPQSDSRETARMSILLLLVASCLALPGRAEAHKVLVNAWVEGDVLLVETAFGDGSAGTKAQVTVRDQASGQVVLQGVADEEGMARLPLPEAVREAGNDLQVVSNAGQGHKATFMVPADELVGQSATVPQDPPAIASGDASETGGATALGTDVAMPPGIDVETLRLLLRLETSRAVREQLQPLRRDLRTLQQQGPRIADIVGGIGWILGLAGLAVLLRRPGRDTSCPPRS